MKHDIFISYRRNGGFETAYYLHEHLEKDGYGVTFDIDALRSGRFDETLLARIDECTDFIVVLNRGCFDRCLDPDFPPENDWLRRELARALEKRKNVIPILLAGFDGFPAHLPGDIDDVRYMNGPKYVPQYIDEFYRILKTRFLRSVPRRKAGKRTGLRLAGLLLAAGLAAGAALSVRMFRDAAGGTEAAPVEDAPAGNPASPAPEAGGREIADAAEMPPAPPAPPAVTAEPAPETEAAEPEAEVAPAAVRKPKIRLSATVDGREVAATVTEGLARGGARTPVTVDLETGGKYRFALEYQTGGKRYAGEVSLKADEVAAKEVRVPLAEVVAKTLTPPPAALAATELGQGARAGEEKTIVLPGGAAMRMVWCPPGTFTMGSPEGEAPFDGETRHRVTLTRGFWLAKTEVTEAQWRSVMGRDAPSRPRGDDYPAGGLGWEDCQAFCGRAGLRLPTESQWEYACRAGSTGAFAGTGDPDGMGWHYGNSGGGPHPVARKSPNAWGLHDMHGNLWEWCADWDPGDWGTAARVDPLGGEAESRRHFHGNAFHSSRGGSYFDDAVACRSADRGGGGPSFKETQFREIMGFRPAAVP